MSTIADLKRGSLVRWWASAQPANPQDTDDLGIVVKMPGENWSGNYHIAWSITNTVSHHSPDMIEESLYQGQMEIV